jgi:hypothetical protein
MGHHQATLIAWGDHCTVRFVFCTYRHIVVIAVNLVYRIFLSYFSQQPFQCSFIFSVVHVCMF